MNAVQSPDLAHYIPNDTNDVKRERAPTCAMQDTISYFRTLIGPGRRGSTVLNPRTYVKQEIWKQAPILAGSTKFEPLHDVQNILITGGAGFMYVGTVL
jgi:hypothetical protein